MYFQTNVQNKISSRHQWVLRPKIWPWPMNKWPSIGMLSFLGQTTVVRLERQHKECVNQWVENFLFHGLVKLILNLKTNNDYIHSLEVTIVPSLVSIKQMVHNILSEQHRDDEQFLTFEAHNLKISRLHLLCVGTSTVPSLATFKQRGQNILSRQHLYKDQQFDLDLWPCDLKLIGTSSF